MCVVGRVGRVCSGEGMICCGGGVVNTSPHEKQKG